MSLIGGNNALASSRDLGQHANYNAVLTGRVGAEIGAATIFFKATATKPARIGIRKRDIEGVLDRYVRIGISDEYRASLPLTLDGYATSPDADDSLRLPAGTYYFAVASDRWQASPFEIQILLESRADLQGAANLSVEPQLKIHKIRLSGIATGSGASSGSLRPSNQIRPLNGVAGGELTAALTLALFRGATTLTMAPYGRLRQDHRLEGIASGACLPSITIKSSELRAIATGSMPNLATMNVRRAYGYDY